MRISGSDIAMSGGYSYLREARTSERLEVWVDQAGEPSAAPAQAALPVPPAAAAAAADQTPFLSVKDAKLLLYKLLIEKLTGKKIDTINAEELNDSIADTDTVSAADNDPGGAAVDRAGWGMRYDYSESLYERQKSAFNASGVIRTTDNREIAFTVAVSLESEVYSESAVSVRAGDAARIDPLVINFNGPAAALSGTRFWFDLDANGESEYIPFVGAGSGILVLDKNGDGRVTDGAELFGPLTGDGFAELSGYDADGNSWIDAGDEVFSRLRVWTRDADGNDFLLTLQDKNVSALYLNALDAQYVFMDSSRQETGVLRRCGLYVSGETAPSVGTLQQIDLVV